MTSISNEWQVQLDTNNKRDGHLLDTGLWSDVTFVVGTGPQQISIKAHKLILSRVSPVFASLYYGEKENQQPVTTDVPEHEPDVFKTMLVYIYTNDVKIYTLEMSLKLYQISIKYVLPNLTKECLNYIRSNIKIENSVMVYDFARVFNIADIMNGAMSKIQNSTKEALSENNISNVGIKTMVDIFSEDRLNIDSEMELFKIAEIYSRTNINQENTNYSEITKPELSVHDLIKKIRFLTLTAEEFTEGTANSDILTPTESLKILKRMSSSKTKFAMPDGFCLSTDKRNNKYLCFTRMFDTISEWDSNSTRNTCLLTFQTNTSIEILGLQVTTQIQSNNLNETYEENLDISIWCVTDDLETVLEHYFKQVVAHNSLQEILFDLPCCIEGNKEYTIFMIFNNRGQYPIANTKDDEEMREGNVILDIQYICSRSGIIRKLIFKK